MMCCLEDTSVAPLSCIRTCICAALFSSQVVTMSGPFRPVTSSTPVVSRGAVIAESYPPVRKILDAEGTRTVFI